MSNEPYKSRLFNFLNRQTIRWQDKLGITIRRLRSITEMGIQLMLYPFYLMVQTGRAFRQKLESKVQSSSFLSETKSSKSDSSLTTTSVPLDAVLNLVEPWLETREKTDSITTNTIAVDILPVNQQSDQLSSQVRCDRADLWLDQSSLPQRQEKPLVTSSQLETIHTNVSPLSPQSSHLIQGFASLLASREIVLVDHHNQILNVLNQRAQQILKQYFAKRHQKPSRLVTTTRKVLASLPQISQNNSANIAPVKFFWQMLDWLQTSPVARKVNLFGESKLASSSPVLPSSNTVDPRAKFLVSLDNKVADLETKSFLSTSVSSNYLARSSQNQVYINSNPFQIRAIIKAAIDYFFVKNSSRAKNTIKGSSRFTLPNSTPSIPLESKTASSYLPGESPKLNLSLAKEENSWLSWNDIFSNTISSTVKPRSSEQKTSITQPQESASLFSLPQDNSKDFTSITHPNNSENQLETDSDLLETKATTVGYEKHPLVRILELLDRIILWLEERLVKIWRILK